MEPTGILLMKLAMKTTAAEDFFDEKNKVIVYSSSRYPNISGILLLYRKLLFKTLDLSKNSTFPTLRVYRLKERPFKMSVFIAFTNQIWGNRPEHMYILHVELWKCALTKSTREDTPDAD